MDYLQLKKEVEAAAIEKLEKDKAECGRYCHFETAFKIQPPAEHEYMSDWYPEDVLLTDGEAEYWKPLHKRNKTFDYTALRAEQDITRAVEKLRNDAQVFGKRYLKKDYTPDCMPL